MLLTDQWQEIVQNGNLLLQKSNKASVSLCYAAATPTNEPNFGLDTREAIVYPASIDTTKNLYARASKSDANCTLTIEEVKNPTLIVGTELESTSYSSNFTLPANPNRKYLFIISLGGTATLAFGDGLGQVPLAANGHYEPLIATTGTVVITLSGTVTVVEG